MMDNHTDVNISQIGDRSNRKVKVGDIVFQDLNNEKVVDIQDYSPK